LDIDFVLAARKHEPCGSSVITPSLFWIVNGSKKLKIRQISVAATVFPLTDERPMDVKTFHESLTLRYSLIYELCYANRMCVPQYFVKDQCPNVIL